MITKEATYEKAFKNKAERLKKKERTRETLLSAAYEAAPRLKEIDRELSEFGAALAIIALSGDNEKLSTLKRRCEQLSVEKQDLLYRNGVRDIEYECPICCDKGLVSGKICECIKKEASQLMAAELSKQMPLCDCRFDNFDLSFYSDKADGDGAIPQKRMASILKSCRDFVDSFNPYSSASLLFMGNAGLGKTHLTMAIVSGVIEKGYFPIYGSAENLFTAIEAEKFSGEGRGTYDTFLNCDLLVIDDLGTEMATSFTRSALYNLINTRILAKKPTIINTNLTMKQIEERYTARISSRLIGSFDGYKFLGNDIRQQKLLAKN